MVLEGGVVAFLDGGIESVAIHVGDGELVEFGVGEDAGGMTGRTPKAAVEFMEAIAAKGGHLGSIESAPDSG